MVFLVCYEFYVPNQAHYFLGIKGIAIGSQKRHNRLPNSPFCDYSNRLLANTLVDDTI
jgi:hypothetical protein